MDKQLALYVIVKGRKGDHVGNLRNFSPKSSLIHRQNAVLLHSDTQGIDCLPVFRILFQRGDHSAYRGFHKTDLLQLRGCEFLFQKSTNIRICIHQILTDQQIQRRPSGGLPGPDSRSKIGNNILDRFCANARCGNICF